MPSNWSKIRDEWLDRTAVAKDDAKWALEALINSEEELFEIEKKIKNKEDAISQVKFLKKKVKETISSKETSLDNITLNTSNSNKVQISVPSNLTYLLKVLNLCFSFPLYQFLNIEKQHLIDLFLLLQPKLSKDK